jgi:hypothetical protein
MLPAVPLSVWSIGADAETSTDSVTWPTSNVKSRRTVCWTWTRTLLLPVALKAASSTLML